MTWTLESIHDGALKLTSRLDSAFRQSEETFAISFVDSHDLPRRIADLARSRLRRIRYVWAYEQKYPAVLRDLDFTPDPRVLVQKISWMDPARNEYEEDTPFSARIENNTNFSKLQLSDEIKFPREPRRIVQLRSDEQHRLSRRSSPASRTPAGSGWCCRTASSPCSCSPAPGWRSTCAGGSRRPPACTRPISGWWRPTTGPWREQEIEEGQILWCDPKYMDEFVKELKTAGSFLDVVRAGGCDFNLGPLPVRFSILMKLGSHLWRRRPQLSSELFESSGAGSVAALDTLIQFLVCRRRLSPFVGLPEGAGGDAPTAGVADRMGSAERHRVEAFPEARHLRQAGRCQSRHAAQPPLGRGRRPTFEA